MNLDLEGKSVVVLAASKGLGKATAHLFAEEGAHVFIASRNEQELEKAVHEIQTETNNEHVHYRVCDITDPGSIKQLITHAAEKHGTIDILVNNAGGPPAGGFTDFDDDAWQNAFELNLLSFIRAIREVLPYMKKQQSGHIVNIASSSIKQTLDNLVLSNTFRAGIVGLVKSLSQELAEDNILINTVGPGRIATDRVTNLDAVAAEKQNVDPEQIRKQSEQSIPMRRYGEPDEFARMIVFLCSQANTYVTGQTLVVDGGLVKAL